MKAIWEAQRPDSGPTIGAVEATRSVFVTKLPEKMTIHWHGMLLPNGGAASAG
jgi:hypothetical protein